MYKLDVGGRGSSAILGRRRCWNRGETFTNENNDDVVKNVITRRSTLTYACGCLESNRFAIGVCAVARPCGTYFFLFVLSKIRSKRSS